MSKFLKKLDYSYLIVVELIFLFFILSLGFSIFLIISEFPDLRSNGHEFSILADSFLHGETYLWKYPFNDLDCVMFGGRCYWELGPFPAIILIPLVFLSNIIGIIFYQGYLQFFISIGVFILDLFF